MKGSTDPHSSSAALLAAFGAAVLDINRLARDKTLERFHRTALDVCSNWYRSSVPGGAARR